MKAFRHPILLAIVCLGLAKNGQANEGKTWSQASLWLKKGNVLEVSAPTDAKRVRLEVLDQDTKNWTTVKTGHLPGSKAGKIYLQMPRDLDRNKLRVVWDRTDPFPYSFYQGRSRFGPRESDPSSVTAGLRSVEFAVAEDATVTNDDATDNVQESDLWQLHDDKLFFFNTMRGLQAVDVSDPRMPEVFARYRLPASGEQMYVVNDGEHIILLARKPGQSWPQSSEVKVLSVEQGKISEVASLDLDASYRESRMVGDKLYVVSEKWEREKLNWQGWEFSYSTRLATFDFSDANNPRKVDEKTLAGSPQVISATNSNLVVVTRDPMNYHYKHVVRVFDLTGFRGIPEQVAELRPGGRVLDKFKLRIRDGILTVISQAYRDQNWRQRYSLLENFKLSSEKLLGILELADRETLYATRFDGDFAYVVTFLQVDPLFIVDLTKPKKPKVVSELKVEGWSEYIQPMGDKLFAVGVEERRVTASIFDVSDKTIPRLAQRVYLGDEGSYSWSEANYDEKAIGRIPSQNLFLVPFQSWDKEGSVDKVQILQTTENGIIKRGHIKHSFRARRAAPDRTGFHIFSISGNELQVTDVANLENPRQTANLPLAWKVDRLLHHNEKILQFEDQATRYAWDWRLNEAETNATLRITDKNNPDKLISSVKLGKGRVAGTGISNGKLHLALDDGKNLRLEVYQLEDNGSATILVSKEIEGGNSSNHDLKPLFLKEGFVAWVSDPSAESIYHPYNYLRRSSIPEDAIYPYPSNRSGRVQAHLFSFEENLAQSTLTLESNSSISITGNASWSQPFILGNRVLYSSSSTTNVFDPEQTWRIVHSEVNASLHGFDLSEQEKVTKLKTASLPGVLVGIQEIQGNSAGAYLITESKDTSLDYFKPIVIDNVTADGLQATREARYGRSLALCAYDGESAYFLDEADLSRTQGPLISVNGNVFVGMSGSKPNGLQVFDIENGRFAKGSNLFPNENLTTLATDGLYLVGRGNSGVFVAETGSGDFLEWPTMNFSGNLYPDLTGFQSSEDGIRIPAGQYGVEFLPRPSGSQIRNLVDRRSTTRENWVLLDESQIRIYEAEDSPLSLDQATSPGWKFRPNSSLDQGSQALKAHWRKVPWFGFFQSRSYPWIYHAGLGWTYVSEAGEDALWLWRPKSGWLWTKPDIFPHLYKHSGGNWIYLDLKNDRTSIRFYDYSRKSWIAE